MAKTLKNREVHICETPQSADLNAAGFAALTYVQVSNIGSIGESGPNTNLPTYDEMDTDVIQKSKGITDAGSPPIEMSYNPTDPGQIIMRAAALTSDDYAIAFIDDDGVIYYNRGKITGPTHPNGRNEDFRLDVFTMGLNQREIVVTTAEQVVPANTLLPSISGAAPDTSDNTLLTAIEGEWAGLPTSYVYQWEKDAAGNGTFAAIGGQTAKVFTGTGAAGNTNRIRVGIKGVNAAGTTAAFVYSMPTVPVVA